VADTGTSGTGSEFTLYNAICNTDWTIPSTMGYDNIPTGGRYPDPDCEGASIIGLLDRFLQKDHKTRITLDQVKYFIDGSQMYPWILNDLDDPDKWLQMTSFASKINVSVHEASDAMSAVHFRWRWGGKIARHITSVFRNVRPIYRSSDTLLDAGTKSDLQSHGTQDNKVVVGTISSPQLQSKRDKGKTRATEPPKDPNTIVTKGLVENWPHSSHVSPSTSKSVSEKRSRFGFLNWRPTKFQSTSPPSPYTQSPSPRTLGTVSGGNPNSRRSEEALRFFRYTQSSEDDDEGGRLTAARRASSWGQGDKELHEVVSVTSIERELNDHDMNVGAGGVSRDGDFGIGLPGPSSFPLLDSPWGPGSSVPDETFEDMNERYGQPIYDEDSSTLASGPGDDDDWQRGSDSDADDADDDGDDDALDSDEENGVTFSPRRRPLNLDD